MYRASGTLAAGADFRPIGPDRTMLHAGTLVAAVDAVRTGYETSRPARTSVGLLLEPAKNVAIAREPMPYGDLVARRV